ncbi:phosphonate metabolism transcriptional regulator PhnF [Acidisphaera sp. L21]|uniref:phosphonate metabolism transcriptional regulator PhnF n=1 Tax=Acidisphaera sp. L21 TaxID=1641851 RepID=UPI00131B8279|nr:phosphonate metabolism transcriptional regulator PhnF [Acidisphaera sp. L21]
MALKRKTGNALWLQVEQALAQDILVGALLAGAQLPTEPALMIRFGVSRFTIRQAIASLENRGLVRAEQGRGTFVHAPTLTYPLSERTRFSRNLIEQGFDPGGEVLSQTVVPAGPDIAAKLGIPEWQSVVHRRGIGKANDIPIELADVFLPLNRLPDFPRRRAEHATYTATLASYGIKDYLRASTQIEARMPSEEEARLLRQAISSPVFVVTRLDTDLDGGPILYGRATWCSDRVTFDLTEWHARSAP